MPLPGIGSWSPLPGDLQNVIVFAAATTTVSSKAEGDEALIDFLQNPAAASVIEAKGMEPR